MSKHPPMSSAEPRRARTSSRLGVVLPADLRARLDSAIERERGEDQSEALRRLLHLGLKAVGK